MRDAWPEDIRRFTTGKPYAINPTGLSGSTVLCFDTLVLKIQPDGEEARREETMLRWLFGRLPVPRVIAAQTAEGMRYLLMQRLHGVMACEEESLRDPAALTQCLADALRMLWQVDVSECPCPRATDDKLRLAARRVAQGLCSLEGIPPPSCAHGFDSPASLLRYLTDNKPEETRVFSHGDFCLPNIFLQNGRVSGLIDLGRAGAADRYQDIALCCRSLQDNVSGRYGGKAREGFDAKLLFACLGMTPDWERLRYYLLLDELF